MSISDTSSSTSSSSTTSLADQPTISAPPLIEVQSSQSEETIVNPASTTIIDTEVVEAKADEIDEEAIKEAVREYGEMERLAPLRTKQILKKALKPAPPAAPDPSVSSSPFSSYFPHIIQSMGLVDYFFSIIRNAAVLLVFHALKTCGGKK